VALRILDSIDLNLLARVDPQAAGIGVQLQRAAGAGRLGHATQLRRDVFMAIAPAEYQLNVPLRPVLERLARAFYAEDGGQVTWNTGAPMSAVAPRPIVQGALISAAALKPIVQGGLPMPGATFVKRSGAQTTFITKGDTGEVLRSDAPFTQRVREPFTATGVSGVTVGGQTWLYSVEPGATGLELMRREVHPHWLGKAQSVTLHPMPSGIHWPQMTALPDGRVALAAVVPNQGPYLALSSDGGKTFTVTSWLGQTAADSMSLAHLGHFADGTLAVTTQLADARGLVQSYARTTKDGVNFTAPVPVSSSNPNVHDAFVVPRNDGDVDLYYVQQEATAFSGFSAFRRKMAHDGSLGPEQRLTGADVGSVEKPQAFRLPDGSVRLVMAHRKQLDHFDVVTTVLESDAP
jgi:hypothetical protein